MPDVTHVVVRLPLTDEQIEAFVMGSECGKTPDETVRDIGTPVPDSGLEVVGWGLYSAGGANMSVFTNEGMAEKWAKHFGRALHPIVRRSDAEAQIAARDAKIAELTAKIDTIARETREACAKVCDNRYGELFDKWEVTKSEEDFFCMGEAMDCAAAIRRAGEKA